MNLSENIFRFRPHHFNPVQSSHGFYLSRFLTGGTKAVTVFDAEATATVEEEEEEEEEEEVNIKMLLKRPKAKSLESHRPMLCYAMLC